MKEVYKFISEHKSGSILSVKLVPNSSFSKIADFTDEFVRIKISSPPIENRANKELVTFLSNELKVNKSKIEIISGEKSKLKKVLIKDITQEQLAEKFSL